MTLTEQPQLESLPDDPQPVVSVPRWARALAFTGRTLVGGGVVLALFAAFQIWGTGVHEARAQSELRGDFEDRLERAQARLADLLSASGSGASDDIAPPEE